MRIISERLEQPFHVEGPSLHVRGRLRRHIDRTAKIEPKLHWNIFKVATSSGREGKILSRISADQTAAIWDTILALEFSQKRPIRLANGKEARGKEGEIYDIPGYPTYVVKKYLGRGPLEGLEPHFQNNHAMTFLYDTFYDHKQTNPIYIPTYLGTLEIPGGDSFILMEKLPEGFLPLGEFKDKAAAQDAQAKIIVDTAQQSLKMLSKTINDHYPLWNRLWQGGLLSAETKINLLARTNPETKQVELAIVDL